MELGDTPALRARLPVVIGIAAVGLAVADSLRTVGVQSIITIAIFVIVMTTFLNSMIVPRPVIATFYDARQTTRTTPPLPLILFVMWAAGSMLAHPLTKEGIQNLVVLVTFLFAIPAAAAGTSEGTPPRVLRTFRNAGIVLSAFYLVLGARFGSGVDYIVSARAVGGSLLPCLAVTIASRRVLKTSRWPLLMMVAAISLSLSRAATAVALLLLMTLAARGARSMKGFRLLLWGGALAGVVYFAFHHFAAFRERFTQGDNYQLGGLTVSTSGRSVLWSAVYHHWLQHRWIGFGAGNAERFTTATFKTIDHPHNDYLRLLNDYGIIGTALFVAGVMMLFGGARRRYKASVGLDQAAHLAAMLSVVSLLMFMVANNPLVGIFGMLAVGGINGVSLARGATLEIKPHEYGHGLENAAIS